MIELIGKKDNLDFSKTGHQHTNKEALDTLSVIGDRLCKDGNALRELKDGAVIEMIEYTTDENGVDILRLIFNSDESDSLDYSFIDIPITYFVDTYLEDYDLYGVSVVPYAPMPQTEDKSNNSGATYLNPNTLYNFGEVDILHIYLIEGRADYVQNYYFTFIANNTTMVTFPTEVKWGNDNAIEVEGGFQYEVSITNNIALWSRVPIEAVSE